MLKCNSSQLMASGRFGEGMGEIQFSLREPPVVGLACFINPILHRECQLYFMQIREKQKEVDTKFGR